MNSKLECNANFSKIPFNFSSLNFFLNDLTEIIYIKKNNLSKQGTYIKLASKKKRNLH